MKPPIWARAVALALLALLALSVSPDGGEAQQFIRRAKVEWIGVDNPIQVILNPGESVPIPISFQTTLQVTNARMVLQSPNGSRIMRLESAGLDATIAPFDPQSATLAIEVPPGYRNKRASARIYLADRGSVLVPPLNVRVQVLHPTPEQLALTPVVIPTNHLRLLKDRFNIREFTVVHGTSLTFTNGDTRQHSVLGRLCAAGDPGTLSRNCQLDEDVQEAGSCPATVDGRLVCFDSGPLDPQGSYTLTMTRPNPREKLRYLLVDGTGNAPTMRGYLTVK